MPHLIWFVKKGADYLTARDLGAKLKISAKPIFTAFKNMEEMKNAVTVAGVKMFKEYSKNFTDYTPAFKQMGMQIVSFATLSAMKVYEYTEEQNSDMLTREFTGAVIMIKSNAKKHKPVNLKKRK